MKEVYSILSIIAIIFIVFCIIIKNDENNNVNFNQEVKEGLNDIDTIKKVNKKLKTEKPKIEGKRGCYRLTVDNIDIWTIA